MASIEYPPTATNEDKRTMLIGHLVEEHGATPDDMGHAITSFDMLEALHEGWDYDTATGGSYFDATTRGGEIVLTIQEGDDIYTYEMPPDEAVRLGTNLLKSAAINMVTGKFDYMSLLG